MGAFWPYRPVLTLYQPTLESVRYVAANMRAADAEEIWPLRFDKTPEGLATVVMSDPTYCWLVALERPIAVFGMFQVRPKAWTAFAFGTDEFSRVAGEMTKFLCRKVRPHLFGELGAQRVEAWSHANHTEAHKWLELLGASGEPDLEYGPDGQTYIRYVMRRSDWLLSQPKNHPKLMTTHGRTPDLASPAAL